MNLHLRLAPEIADESSISVVLADDHALMRRSLRALLEGDRRIVIVAEADNMAALERALRRHRPRVLVLDLGLPEGPGLLAIGHLRRTQPDTRIVIVTMQDSPALPQLALPAGASGFVLKDHAEKELVDAVRAAARDGELSDLAARPRSWAPAGSR